MSNNINSIINKLSRLSQEQRQLLKQALQNQQTGQQIEQNLGKKSANNSKRNQNNFLLDYVNQRHQIEQLPLSFSQERLWFFEQFNPNSCAYYINRAVKLTGKLDINALEQSLQIIIQRHEILRTNYFQKDGVPIQKIQTNPEFKLTIYNLPRIHKNQQDEKLNNLLSKELRKPFNLSKDLMLRASLYCIEQKEYIFLVILHHIAGDGWSLGVLTKELNQLYNALINNQPSPLPELPLQYADFSLWQKNWYQGNNIEPQLNYWREKFQGEIPLLNLPTDYPRPALETFKGSFYALNISSELVIKFKQLSKQLNTTLFMVLLTAFKVLLYRYTHEEDIIVGTPIAGRNYLEIEGLIGFFVNTLALRTDLSGNPTFDELLQRVKQTSQEAYTHQELSYEKLIQELDIDRDLSRAALTQVMFAFQNTPETSLNLSGLEISSYGFNKRQAPSNLSLSSYLNTLDDGTAKCDLTFLLKEEEGEIRGIIEFNSDLFNRDTISRMSRHFQVLLEGIINNPYQKISFLPLLTSQEKHQQLFEWNETQVNYPQGKCIHQLFEEQVKKTPENIAVIFENKQLTYKQLNEKANQLAHYLQKLGVKPETLVGICVERSPLMIVGLLAILKAGGAYVPLDPNYPHERLKFILEDSQISILLTQDKLVNFKHLKINKMIKLDRDWHIITQENNQNLINLINSNSLAYIIYTSGTTGQPKGVLIEHKSVVNLIKNQEKLFQIKSGTKILQFFSLNFDGSVWEIFPSLSLGVTLYLISTETQLNPLQLNQFIRDNSIEILTIPPSVLAIFSDDELPDLKIIAVGGEACGKKLADKWNQKQKTFFNAYGPTEATVCATTAKIGYQDEITIGHPISNSQVYILDSYLQPLPIGAKGEIYIGGNGLARGYLNNEKLTAEKFIDNPFREGKLYKTGDLAHYLADGSIKYLGRIDNQVKIRGFRIELGEIESNLNQHQDVKDSIVIAQENKLGNKYLTAYIVKENRQPEKRELRNFLSEKLPKYMIPSVFVCVDIFPLTPNGKVDIKALPFPDFANNREEEYIAPSNPTEVKLALIWQTVLGRENIGINNSFFELGGHSLLATQVISRIHSSFQIDLSVRHLFEFPTIGELAIKIEKSTKNQDVTSIRTISRKQMLPVSFAQERLWFLTQLEGNNDVYNMGTVVKLKGELNLNALQKAVEHLCQRHEILRSNIKSQAGKPYLIINSDTNYHLEIINPENGENRGSIIQEKRKQIFDLAKDKLVRFTLLAMSAQEHIFIISIHHTISDGWSMGILRREISHLYQAYSEHQTPTLPKLAIQYVDFAHWQRQYLQGKILEAKIGYWREELKEALPLSTFPTDYPRGQNQTFTGAKYNLQLDKNIYHQLKNLSNREGVTLFITLLTAFKVLLYRHTLQEQLIIGFPIAGRNNLEIENLIGFFANTLLVNSQLGGNPQFIKLLHQLKKSVLKAYENQDLPFEKLVAEIQPERELNHNPLFQVWFNMVNIERPSLELYNLEIEPYCQLEDETTIEQINSKFDLTVYLKETKTRLELIWVYNRNLYKQETINWLGQQYQNLLETVVNNPTAKINEIPLLKDKASQPVIINNLIKSANKWQKFLPSEIEQSIIQRFEQQVALYPETIALKTANHQWSYQQLDERANAIANYILSLWNEEVEPKQIAILLEYDVQIIASILAVLKTGNIYVPLDCNDPLDRLEYIVEDSQITLLLTNTGNKYLAKQLSQEKVSTINIDEIPEKSTQSMNDSLVALNPENIAYILYTSGSTGKPKGVVQTNRNILHFIRNQTNSLQINNNDRLSLLASINFDAAVMDIYGALLNGATLCLYDLKSNGIHLLPQWLQDEKITIYHSTPTVYRYLLKEISIFYQGDTELLPHLRLILLGGEEVIKTDVEAYQEYFSDNCLLINGYGSSESSFNCQYIINQNTIISNEKVSIGKPMENMEILLLDEQGNETQICGEIAIRSEYIALEYWQKPELTKKVFLADLEDSKKRIYRTGDWGRLRSDGSLEFLGRKDFQVKIRGIRIELGEIEANLNQYPNIRESILIALENKLQDKYLVAYVIMEDEQKANVKQLRKYLKPRLPEYMIPSAFVFLDSFPLTPSGKINRKALPSPDLESNREEEYIAPRTIVEQQLAEIWAEILNLETVGIYDNFFELGGHSLLAVQLFAEMKSILDRTLPLATLFKFPTIEQLAQVIDQSTELNQPWDSLVLLKAGGDKTPLFLIHDADGEIMLYLNLARRLHPERPVYALRPYGKEGLPILHTRIEDVINHYLERIRSVQAQGPYLLSGLCLGGSMAFRLGQALQAQGQSVGLIALLDVIAPKTRRIRRTENVRKIEGKYKLLLYRFLLERELPIPQFLYKNISVKMMFRLLGKGFRDQKFQGQLVLFKASEGDGGETPMRKKTRAPLFGWERWATEGVLAYDIPGTHSSMLQEPNVQLLANQIEQCIKLYRK